MSRAPAAPLITETLEKKVYSDQRAKTVLLSALRGKGGKLTHADAMTVSGLPGDETRRALGLLLKEYRSHLGATESGELIYEFDAEFERRDAVPLRERVARVGLALWKGFSAIFKVAIMATLVVYFTAFVAMLIALVFARSAGSDRDDDDGGGFGGLFWIWGWGWGGDDPYGRRRPARPRKPPFYKSVFAFVFGPPLPPVDPLLDEKEILAFIRAHDGRIAAVDLVRLMGWDFARAEEEVTRLMVDYDGEPEVTDDGVVVYVFRDLRKTAAGAIESVASEVTPRLAWERIESEPVLTGNSGERNAIIGFFNAFNLSAPLWVVPAFEAKFQLSLAGWGFFLHDFPLAFSGLFFGVPLLRWLKARSGRRRRAAANQRRSLLRRIFSSPAPRPREEIAPSPELAAALDRELVGLGGDVDADDSGTVRYHFPRIRQELQAVARARAAAPRAERDPGALVFSSNDLEP